MLSGLADKVVVVTGASSGIGRAIAERFVAEGSTVISVSRRERPVPGAEWWGADVASADELQAVLDDVTARHGRLDAPLRPLTLITAWRCTTPPRVQSRG